jgi:hypothetical protein
MKRSMLIGAALVFALTAVGCSDDDEDTAPKPDAGSDSGRPADAGSDAAIINPGIDSGLGDAGDAGSPGTDSGLDSGRTDAATDAGVPADASSTTADASGLDAST